MGIRQPLWARAMGLWEDDWALDKGNAVQKSNCWEEACLGTTVGTGWKLVGPLNLDYGERFLDPHPQLLKLIFLTIEA